MGYAQIMLKGATIRPRDGIVTITNVTQTMIASLISVTKTIPNANHIPKIVLMIFLDGIATELFAHLLMIATLSTAMLDTVKIIALLVIINIQAGTAMDRIVNLIMTATLFTVSMRYVENIQ